MKRTIEIGQCYEKNDIIYEVVVRAKAKDFWHLREVITKEEFVADTELLLSMRRPFENFG